MSADQCLRPRERLRKRREYLAVQRQGKRHYSALFVILWAPGPNPWPRLGVTASRKVGGAVQRNRVKRLVREAFRRHKGVWPEATDIVVIASAATAKARYVEVEQALLAWARGRQVRGGRPSAAQKAETARSGSEDATRSAARESE